MAFFPNLTAVPPPGPPRRDRAAAQASPTKRPQPSRAAAPDKSKLVAAGAARESPPVGPRLSALIARDELEKLAAKRIAFDAPARMRAGVKEKIEARIDANFYEELAKNLKDLGMADGYEIASGSSIRAALEGDAFEIGAAADGEQALADKVFAPWIWEVTPLRSGSQPLTLTVTVASRIAGGGDEKKELRVATKNIEVQASPVRAMLAFVETNGVWLAAVLLATGLAGWLLRRQRI